MTEKKIVILKKGKKARRPTKIIEYRKTLKNLVIDEGEIALIIIPSFSFEKQDKHKDKHEDNQLFSMEMLTSLATGGKTQKVRNLQTYCERIQQIAALLEETKANINRFFVSQNTITTTDWLNDLLLTYNSLKGLSTFPHEYLQTIPRLWYSQKENSKMEIITKPDFFWELTKEKKEKFINVLFLDRKRTNWIKNFFKEVKIEKTLILPTIPLLLLSLPE